MGQIVKVNTRVVAASKPATLQQSGAFVSQGGTTLTAGTFQFLATVSALSSILTGAKAITSITQTAGLATVATTQPHGFVTGDTLPLTIAGALPAAYNGTFVATVTGASAFTYAVPSGTTSPATGTIVYTPEDVAELTQMNSTFFGQGSAAGAYVLELGAGNASDGITALDTYITANPNSQYVVGAEGYFYAYLVPRYWSDAPSYLTFLAKYESPSSQTYFFTTATLSNYKSFTSLMKDGFVLIETPATGAWPSNVITAASYANGLVTLTTTTAHGVSPGEWFQVVGISPIGYDGYWLAAPGTTASTLIYAVPSALGAETALGSLVASGNVSTGAVGNGEFTQAAPFYQFISQNPSSTSKLAPFAFRFLFGVTPWPTGGNSTLFAALKAANINIVGTGAEGGISTAVLFWGTTMDGNDLSEWYSVDWVAINSDLRTAAAVINGSNNPAAPLYYNQAGVDYLQGVESGVMRSAISFGMALGQLVLVKLDADTFASNLQNNVYAGQVVVNAEPLTDYSVENPGDYAEGTYSGISVAYTPARGFTQIVYNVDVFNIAP